jgi:hypothetical protein
LTVSGDFADGGDQMITVTEGKFRCHSLLMAALTLNNAQMVMMSQRVDRVWY